MRRRCGIGWVFVATAASRDGVIAVGREGTADGIAGGEPAQLDVQFPRLTLHRGRQAHLAEKSCGVLSSHRRNIRSICGKSSFSGCGIGRGASRAAAGLRSKISAVKFPISPGAGRRKLPQVALRAPEARQIHMRLSLSKHLSNALHLEVFPLNERNLSATEGTSRVLYGERGHFS